jgi:hypothetical protein
MVGGKVKVRGKEGNGDFCGELVENWFNLRIMWEEKGE